LVFAANLWREFAGLGHEIGELFSGVFDFRYYDDALFHANTIFL
jgi:hypothetical protein